MGAGGVYHEALDSGKTNSEAVQGAQARTFRLVGFGEILTEILGETVML